MLRNNKYEEIDKAMSKRIHEVFDNPAKHTFYSCYDAYIAEDLRGPRGGKIRRGRKQKCFHCGHGRKGHAEVTEQL